MPEFQVSVDQTYVSCAPGRPIWLRVDSIDRANGTARVSNPNSIYRQYRPRTIQMTQLHPTGQTRTGKARRSGYRLLSQPVGTTVHLCLHCFHYVESRMLHEEPGVIRTSICKPCKREVEELMQRISNNRAALLED
ncbi:hypothetical protein [Streptomyces gardneri]|uniref:hypothetical protein n=1 Tax=Streptomyces gardneri TaxID=66892 RepID=UPI0035D6F67B